MRHLRKKEGQKGFTLIEIIAVLVLLGILAAVAVPRFIGMQDQARASSANSIIAAGVSQINMEYARQILLTGSGQDAWAAVVANPQAICDDVSMQGFDTPVITCTADADGTITVAASVDGQSGDAVDLEDPS